VVAGSRYLAEDALALIDVDYAPLPVTVSAWQTPGSVPVHDEAPDNVLLSRTFAAGDVEAAFAAADLVVERELITNRHAGNPLGVRGVGEGGTLGPAAALAGAVGDALGVTVDRLPITPSGLWELMRQEPAQ
jgi:CO/xanthine dehydrogenase Mo-binding subunit